MASCDLKEAPDVFSAILAEETFRPSEPGSLAEAGLPDSFVDGLICKYLSIIGATSGRAIADYICLPFGVLEQRFQSLRVRQFIKHVSSAPLNDYCYSLTESGAERAEALKLACGYIGPAPVPLADYVVSVEAQTIRAEAPMRPELERAFEDILVNPALFDALGPAVNSGAGLFLYGAPGNGKTTLAERVTGCFGQQVWIPRALIDDGQIIKLFDAAYHDIVDTTSQSILKSAASDRRWVKVRRPTVVVGGELTMDALEIRHDPASNTSEAPLHLKSNCGSLLIDDFGRQRMDPVELLNRWIVPLEKRYDFLTLSTGKKIQVPFEQLIIFSTNLEPSELVDEAFLRRIPYKIAVPDPDEAEFHHLFELYARNQKCEYRRDAVEHLLNRHYRPIGRALRRCHPRDLLAQIGHYCKYNGLRTEMRPEYFDMVVKNYFTVVLNEAGK